MGVLIVAVSVLFNEPKLLKYGRGSTLYYGSESVSVLFNEPKLLKCDGGYGSTVEHSFSALQRAEIAEIDDADSDALFPSEVSVLFNEPKLLKSCCAARAVRRLSRVSVLFNEPKLLKSLVAFWKHNGGGGFSALQRAEIAEMLRCTSCACLCSMSFSALQRAEIAEMSNDMQQRTRFGYTFQCSSTSRNC